LAQKNLRFSPEGITHREKNNQTKMIENPTHV
jgi:hypothetical protein